MQEDEILAWQKLSYLLCIQAENIKKLIGPKESSSWVN